MPGFANFDVNYWFLTAHGFELRACRVRTSPDADFCLIAECLSDGRLSGTTRGGLNWFVWHSGMPK